MPLGAKKDQYESDTEINKQGCLFSVVYQPGNGCFERKPQRKRKWPVSGALRHESLFVYYEIKHEIGIEAV